MAVRNSSSGVVVDKAGVIGHGEGLRCEEICVVLRRGTGSQDKWWVANERGRENSNSAVVVLVEHVHTTAHVILNTPKVNK